MTILNIFVTSPDTHSERRIDSSSTIQQLKEKLTPITGIAPQHQVLRLYRSAEAQDLVALLDTDTRTLESYGIQEYQCLQVENTDPNARPGEWNDLSAVDKFELTKEEYEARNGKCQPSTPSAPPFSNPSPSAAKLLSHLLPSFCLPSPPSPHEYEPDISDTVLSHLKANKLGRFADQPETLSHAPPPPFAAPADITVGARCQVEATASDLARRGTVRFVDEATIGRGGVWVGVELDEPTGKGDGSYNGKRFFTCRPMHGVFVRPDKVQIGDFPEVDIMDEEDDEI